MLNQDELKTYLSQDVLQSYMQKLKMKKNPENSERETTNYLYRKNHSNDSTLHSKSQRPERSGTTFFK